MFSIHAVHGRILRGTPIPFIEITYLKIWEAVLPHSELNETAWRKALGPHL